MTSIINGCNITLEKFGQIPDDHYFDKPFKPIVVTGDAGKKVQRDSFRSI